MGNLTLDRQTECQLTHKCKLTLICETIDFFDFFGTECQLTLLFLESWALAPLSACNLRVGELEADAAVGRDEELVQVRHGGGPRRQLVRVEEHVDRERAPAVGCDGAGERREESQLGSLGRRVREKILRARKEPKKANKG